MPLIPSEIPSSLWANDALQVPPALLAAHLDDLKKENLLQLATAGPQALGRRGPIGGESTVDFRNHYATMFRAGACRVCAVLLDPSSRLASVPSDLQASFSAGSICVLDAPSGACTASLGILAALLELRIRGKIPQLPQTVHVFAADISPDALEKGRELFEALKPALLAVGITANVHTRRWDATASAETAALPDWISMGAPHAAEHLFICESFSGATSAEKEKEAENRFRDFSASVAVLISLFGHGRTTFLWIEPRTKDSRYLFGFLGDIIHSLRRQQASDKHEHEYNWFNTLIQETHRCNVKILRYLRNG